MPTAVTDVRSCPSRTRQTDRACERRPRRDAAHWHVPRVTKRRLCLTGRGALPGGAVPWTRRPPAADTRVGARVSCAVPRSERNVAERARMVRGFVLYLADLGA